MQGYIVQARPQYCSNSLIVNGLFDLSLALSVTSHPLCFCPHQDFMAPFLLQMCCLDKSEHQTWNIKYHVHPKCNTKKNVKIKTFAKSILNLPVIQMKSFYEVETPLRDIFVMPKMGKFDKYFVLFGCSNLDESNSIQCALIEQ